MLQDKGRVLFLYLPLNSTLYLEGYKYLFCRYRVSKSVSFSQCKRIKYSASFCMCLLNIQLFLITFFYNPSVVCTDFPS